MLPLLLALLMVLFDNTAHGVLVLLGMLLGWLRDLLAQGGGGLPPFRSLTLHPWQIALASLARALPCVAGLMLVLTKPAPGPRWWWVVLVWTIAAIVAGEPVTAVLLPGLLTAILFALHVGAAQR